MCAQSDCVHTHCITNLHVEPTYSTLKPLPGICLLSLPILVHSAAAEMHLHLFQQAGAF